MSRKIVSIVGARPQFVKAAVLSRALKAKGITEVLVHTGQHFDHGMSDVFFEEMEIPHPQYHLGINSLTHGAMTGRMIEKIEAVLLDEKPDVLVVYGDTNSTLAGALAASKLHIPVAHVEAGLRSFNMEMPEEINRILTDRISSYLFCPSNAAIRNLEKEGFASFNCKLVKTGDVMYDAAMFYSEKSAERSTVAKTIDLEKPYMLTTLHRQENTDDPAKLEAIVGALNQLNEQMRVLLPMHPRTRKMIEKAGLKLKFTVIDPVGYFDMIELLKHCRLVMTDSGGLQKEAYFFGKNCVTLREQTEWTELVEYGYNVLSGADEQRIVELAMEMLNRRNDFATSLYGDGHSGDHIAQELLEL